MAFTPTAVREAAAPAFRVHDARFVTSAPTVEKLPATALPEIAFVGRSNVGKSSLLNCLVDRKNLVKVSSTPGRTRLINLFRADVAWHRGDDVEKATFGLLDLPGYGFASTSKSVRASFPTMIGDVVSERPSLRAVVQLFDVRHPPSAQDIEAFHAIDAHAPAHILVATKADKLPRAKQKPAAKVIAKALERSTDHVVLFSAETRQGRDALWEILWSFA